MSPTTITPERLVLAEAFYALYVAIATTRMIAGFHASAQALGQDEEAVVLADLKASNEATFEWPADDSRGHENQTLLAWTQAYATVAGVSTDEAKAAIQGAYDQFEEKRTRLAELWQISCAAGNTEPHRTDRNLAREEFEAFCASFGIPTSVTFQKATNDHRGACIVCQTREE